jgi:rhodanese-related sulfurtransferase
MDKGEAPVVVDLRSTLSLSAEGVKIPGAIHVPPHEFSARHAAIPRGRPVVMVCT